MLGDEGANVGLELLETCLDIIIYPRTHGGGDDREILPNLKANVVLVRANLVPLLS